MSSEEDLTGLTPLIWALSGIEDVANKLRGTVESSEYKHVVLSLIFLKYVSDKFEERMQELIE